MTMKRFGTGIPLFGVAGVSAGVLLAALWTAHGDVPTPPSADPAPAETVVPATVKRAPDNATDARLDWSNVESAGDASMLSIANYDH
jgi:hypothetical protein